MEASIQLGTDVEAQFELVDAKGKQLIPAEMLNNAVLKISPMYYKGMTTQTWGRNCTQSKRGRKVRQFLKLSATTGKHVLTSCEQSARAKITPKFDTLGKDKDDDRATPT